MSDSVDADLFEERYDDLEWLGSGGFGEVYKARQRTTGQTVAIKLLMQFRRGAPGSEKDGGRFQREMELSARLHHPNIVRLIDSGQTRDGRLYSVFDFVPGRTLAQVLESEGALDVRDALRIMGQVLDALACAHHNGVVHRDLKPANIMVTQSGVRRNAMVLDFGVGGYAREVNEPTQRTLTGTGEMIGTPAYSAPEQLRGEPSTPRADHYAWGLIFLECLTGLRVIRGATIDEVLHRQFSSTPVPIPEAIRLHALGRLLATVTSKDPEHRVLTTEAALEALDRIDPADLEAWTGSLREGRETLVVVRKLGGMAERRQVTFLSVRLTPMRESDDPIDVEEYDDLMRKQWATCAAFAAGEDGYIASALGDRALIVFGYPQVREDTVLRAAGVAIRVAEHAERESERLERERGLKLHAQLGMHTGLVVIRERGELIGAAAEAAMRLDALAQPGEILVSAPTLSLMQGRMLAEPRSEQHLGGSSRPFPTFSLTRTARRPLAPETLLYQGVFVGRTRELERLRESWRQTLAGHCQVTLVTGDAGIGKSRLVREWRREFDDDTVWLEARCTPETQSSPLQPILRLLVQALGDDPLRALERYGFDLATTYPLLASRMSWTPDPRFEELDASPQRKQELTLDAILSLIFRMAEERPLAFAVEDLHWADPTTLVLLEHLIDEVASLQPDGAEGGMRLAVVLTTRTDFTPPWSLTDLNVVQLRGLSHAEVQELAAAAFGEARPPREVLAQIALRADGVPLFVEQVGRMILESGRDPASFARLEIPATLRDLLTARLDKLGPSARETGQLAAAIGREFDYEWLSAISEKPEVELRENLGELTAAQLVLRSRRRERFVFKHALVRDTAYESMLRASRIAVHARIAQALESRFPDAVEQQPELLAMHLEAGERGAVALRYWKKAGERSTSRWAHAEAAHQFGKALGLLPELPASRDRDELELELCVSLGGGLLVAKGYGAADVERVYGRARELCRDHADTPLRVVYGIWVMTVTRGDREGSAQLAEWLAEFVDRTSDHRQLLMAHASLGTRAMLSGELTVAEHHLGEAMRRFDPTEYESLAQEYGGNGGLYGHLYMSWCLWYLGHRDRALENQARVMALTEATADPYAIATGLIFEMALAHDAGEPERARAAAERVVGIAQQQSFPYWIALASCGLGWANAKLGDAKQGVAQIEQGLERCRTIGSLVPYAYYSAYLVEALLDAGDIERGLEEADAALRHSERYLDSFYEAELQRLKGELLAARARPGDDVEAEACFGRALEWARRQGARSLELRAALSLARLRPAARPELARVYDGFTEGRRTADLVEAGKLLERLAST